MNIQKYIDALRKGNYSLFLQLPKAVADNYKHFDNELGNENLTPLICLVLFSTDFSKTDITHLQALNQIINDKLTLVNGTNQYALVLMCNVVVDRLGINPQLESSFKQLTLPTAQFEQEEGQAVLNLTLKTYQNLIQQVKSPYPLHEALAEKITLSDRQKRAAEQFYAESILEQDPYPLIENMDDFTSLEDITGFISALREGLFLKFIKLPAYLLKMDTGYKTTEQLVEKLSSILTQNGFNKEHLEQFRIMAMFMRGNAGYMPDEVQTSYLILAQAIYRLVAKQHATEQKFNLSQIDDKTKPAQQIKIQDTTSLSLGDFFEYIMKDKLSTPSKKRIYQLNSDYVKLSAYVHGLSAHLQRVNDTQGYAIFKSLSTYLDSQTIMNSSVCQEVRSHLSTYEETLLPQIDLEKKRPTSYLHGVKKTISGFFYPSGEEEPAKQFLATIKSILQNYPVHQDIKLTYN